MRILVTGATGFVGRYVVPAIVERGHVVRALVRGSTNGAITSASDRVEHFSADLLDLSAVAAAVAGIDVVVHLAICLTRDRDVLGDDTLKATRNLCDAMVSAGVTRLIHCSSRAVYDWASAARQPDESAPLDRAPELRDDYARTKIGQEELIAEFTTAHGWATTILRPGFIWGPGREQLAGWGHSFGPLHVVVDPRRLLPMTYVENCADSFALAVDEPRAAGEVFNIVDDDLPTAWQYAGLELDSERKPGIRVPVPYWPGFVLAASATTLNRALLGGRLKLPGLLRTSGYRARFRQLHFSNQKAKDFLGWRPRFNFAEAWRRTRNAEKIADAGNDVLPVVRTWENERGS